MEFPTIKCRETDRLFIEFSTLPYVFFKNLFLQFVCFCTGNKFDAKLAGGFPGAASGESGDHKGPLQCHEILETSREEASAECMQMAGDHVHEEKSDGSQHFRSRAGGLYKCRFRSSRTFDHSRHVNKFPLRFDSHGAKRGYVAAISESREQPPHRFNTLLPGRFEEPHLPCASE